MSQKNISRAMCEKEILKYNSDIYKEGCKCNPLCTFYKLYRAKEYGICKSLDRFIAWIEPT